jgi:hypothetical protein
VKITALSEQYDGGRDIYVQQEGAHVQISVEATSGSNAGEALLTPAQARVIAEALLKIAADSDEWAGLEAS